MKKLNFEKFKFISFIIILVLFIGYLIVSLFFTKDPIIYMIYSNGKVNEISKLSYYLISFGLGAFCLGVNLFDYIKNKKCNFNLLMAFILFALFLIILPFINN